MKKIQQLIKTIPGVKIIWIVFFSLMLFFSPFPERKAEAWVDTFILKPIQSFLEEGLDQILVLATGAAKQAAVKMITVNVYSAVSGGSGGGGTKFITNWQDTLTAAPKKEASLYIEQLTKKSTQMKGSSLYKSASSALIGAQFEGVGEEGLAEYFQSPRFVDSVSAQYDFADGSKDYAATLQEIGQNIVDEEEDEDPCDITYEDNNTGYIFEDGTFENFSTYMEGTNNPWSYEACVKNAYEEKLAELKKEAETKAVAYQGFVETGLNDMVSYPGILVKEKIANIENMGNEVIANANGLGEVIVSAVMKMGMDAMNKGIGNVQSQTQKKITDVSSKASSQVQNQVKTSGPGKALFGN
jgi:hypothetical protein